jgi:hypothetical protein
MSRLKDMDQDFIKTVVLEEAAVTQTTILLAMFKRIRKRLDIKGRLEPEEVMQIMNIITASQKPEVPIEVAE